MTTSNATKQKKKKGRTMPRWGWWLIGGVGFCIIAIAGSAAYAYASLGTNIVRAVTVAGQNVGGRSSLDAIHQLDNAWGEFSAKALSVQASDRQQTILVAATSSSGEEVVIRAISFDVTEAVNRALTFGRRGSWWQQVRERTSGWLGRSHEMGSMTIDTGVLLNLLRQSFSQYEQAATNTGIMIDKDQSIAIVPSTDGLTFDYGQAIRQIVDRAHRLDYTAINLQTTTAKPTVSWSSNLAAIANKQTPIILARAPLKLKYQERDWTIDRARLETLLGFIGTTDNPAVGFDEIKTKQYLADLAKDINVMPVNAKFAMVGDRVQEFQTSVVGLTLDADKTLAAMQQALINQAETECPLTVNEEKPLVSGVADNKLGITELVSEATTNFRGSPANRRFNLSYGAQLLNGLLIQPGEEFSLVKALGKIDAAHGWKSELVIKGTKIIPEYGGGLCQVGTTMFRVALNAGVPIVERQNHSLRISYYEPPIGLDATIYEPKPDLRFRNDYASALLIQTSVVGDNITFKFYGTKDGRKIDLPTPTVTNRTPIPATKTYEVDDLKPGEKECQSPGHPGANATVTYAVTKADGTTNSQTFTSHYQAIGVICRVGKKAAAKPKKTTTNTNSAINTNSATNTSTD